MIQITPQMRVLMAVEPADFRKGIDGLARLCEETLGQDPFGGWVFVFRSRKATALEDRGIGQRRRHGLRDGPARHLWRPWSTNCKDSVATSAARFLRPNRPRASVARNTTLLTR